MSQRIRIRAMPAWNPRYQPRFVLRAYAGIGSRRPLLPKLRSLNPMGMWPFTRGINGTPRLGGTLALAGAVSRHAHAASRTSHVHARIPPGARTAREPIDTRLTF